MQGGDDFPPLRMVVLVGIPGSGKSTFSERMEGLGWAIVNQDTLGNRRKCENAAVSALQAGREVVIDRCNFDREQRAVWINIARQYNAVAIGVQLVVDVEECIRRCQGRRNHATVSPEKAPAVVTRMDQDFQEVGEDEGLTEFYRVRMDVEFQNMVAYLGPARAFLAPPPVLGPPASFWSPMGQMGPAYMAPIFQPQPYGPQYPVGYRNGGPSPFWDGSSPVRPGQQAQPRREPQGHPESPGYRSMRNERSRKQTGPQTWRDPRSPLTDIPSRAAHAQHAAQGSRPLWVPMVSPAGPAEFLPSPQINAPSLAPHARGRGAARGQEARLSTRALPPPLPPPVPSALHETPAPQHSEVESAGPTPCPPGTRPATENGPASSNIVPFRKGKGTGWPPADGPGVPYLDDGLPDDGRIILLFDLNGTLTSHTAQRHSAGVNRMRPGTHHLLRLKERFRLGIFSSATQRTVKTVLPMLEKAAGSSDGEKLFDTPALILCRQHTVKAPEQHIAGGGKPWDTCKPLRQWFRSVHRVLLVDDDGYKAMPDETANMVQMPCWNDEDSRDDAIQALVNALLDTLSDVPPDADVRQYSGKVAKALAAAVAVSTVPSDGLHDTASDVAGELLCEEAQVIEAEEGAASEDVRIAKSSRSSCAQAAGITVESALVQGVQYDRTPAVQLVPQDTT